MNCLKTILTLLLFGFLFQSCTDVIDVDLANTEPIIVIDAWLDNSDNIQMIKLRQSSPYFDATSSPIINGADVIITDNNSNVFEFSEDGNTGNYIWEDTIGNGFGAIGDSYSLAITIDGQVYSANSAMNRVPVVDSFTYEVFDPAFGGEAEEDGWEAQFYARDFEGVGDTYWIKAFKNGSFLNKPQEINVAFDAGFTGGSEIDGLPFIEPIRSFINRRPDSGDNAEDTNDFPPYRENDTIRVEIHSITNAAFDFLYQAQIQMTLGDNGIFAPPLENVPTNINTPNGAIKAVGFFSVAAIEFLEEIVPELE